MKIEHLIYDKESLTINPDKYIITCDKKEINEMYNIFFNIIHHTEDIHSAKILHMYDQFKKVTEQHDE